MLTQIDARIPDGPARHGRAQRRDQDEDVSEVNTCDERSPEICIIVTGNFNKTSVSSPIGPLRPFIRAVRPLIRPVRPFINLNKGPYGP